MLNLCKFNVENGLVFLFYDLIHGVRWGAEWFIPPPLAPLHPRSFKAKKITKKLFRSTLKQISCYKTVSFPPKKSIIFALIQYLLKKTLIGCLIIIEPNGSFINSSSLILLLIIYHFPTEHM